MTGIDSAAGGIAQPRAATVAARANISARLLANDWASAALIFFVTRSFALLGAYVGVTDAVQKAPERNKGWVAELALNWDAAWYVVTSQQGYSWDPSVQAASNIAFPPLMPALLSALANFIRWISFGWNWGNDQYGTWVVAGFLISNVSFYVALVLLIRTFTERLGRRNAVFAVFAFASFPLAFFFSAIYTEGLFLLLALGAWLVSRTGWQHKWLAASALGLLAVLLKFAGILLAPVLLVEYMSQHGWRLRKIRFDILWLALIPAGIVFYMLYLWWRFSDPTAFLDAQSDGWYHRASFFLTTYWEDAIVRTWKSITGQFIGHYDFVQDHGSGNVHYALFDALLPILLLVGAFIARKKLYAAEWAWLILGIIYPLSAGHTNSLARYMLPLWPGMLWLGMLGRRGRWPGVLLILAWLAMLAWCAGLYANAVWIG
jgi:hypothetical protein